MSEQEPPQIKVFTTPELLEIILLHLDIRTLLVSAQRVCQTWTGLIQSSPAIQQVLFFQTSTRKDKWHAQSICKEDTNPDSGSIDGDKSPIYNPLLVQAFRPFFPSAHEHPQIHDNEEEAAETKTKYAERKKERGTPFSFKPLDMFSSPEKKTAYLRKEASWRKMLLCQPPVHGGVTVFKMFHGPGGDSYKCYQVPQKESVDNSDTETDDILKMGPFLTTLTQNRDLYFGDFGHTRVYWSAYVPPLGEFDSYGRAYPSQGGSFAPTVKKGFAEAIAKSGIVIFSREVLQCVVGLGRELTDEESLREEIAEAEAEAEGSKGGQ